MVEDGRRSSVGADDLDPYGCPIHPGVPGSVRSVARSAHIPVERDVCATRRRDISWEWALNGKEETPESREVGKARGAENDRPAEGDSRRA